MKKENPTCLNCSTPLVGVYCHACGQSSKEGRITNRRLLVEIPATGIDVKRGFAHSIWTLATKPAATIKTYLEGKRVSHYKPFALLLGLLLVYFLIGSWLGWGNDLVEINEGKDSGVGKFLSENPQILSVFSMIFIALGMRLTLFKAGYNYAEHLYIHCFVLIVIQIYAIILGPVIVQFISADIFSVTTVFIQIILSCFVYYKLLHHKMNGAVIVLLTLLGHILSLILIAIVAVGILLLIFSVFPTAA
ncbi:MAG: hypothetical protein ACI837_001376 [Crocinitomicaceae bacterium]|jgi:hypothetical protein